MRSRNGIRSLDVPGHGQQPPGGTRSAILTACILAVCSLQFFAASSSEGEVIAGAASRYLPAGAQAGLRRLAGGPGPSAQGNHTAEVHAGGHNTTQAASPSIFFLVTFTASAATQNAVQLLPYEFRPPHSVLLYFVGTVLAALATGPFEGSEYGDAIASFMDVDPHVIFWVLLPALLYEDAAGAEWHVIQRVLPSALLLALPGVIVNTLLTGTVIRYCMNAWKWPASLLLGSILAATDPVAVVGALTALNAPAKLSHLISGESLFNDGSAVALFQIFLEVASGAREFEPGHAITMLIQLAAGGPLLGLAVALLCNVWLRNARALGIQVMIIIVCVYGSFIVGEHNFHVSGVLAVVVFGLFMSAVGRFSLNLECEHEYHAIIKFLALISHESIFIIAGVIGFKFLTDTETITGRDYADLALLYVAIHITRALVILLFWPLLTHMGYGLTWREAVICVFGGLRGAVGLALASMVDGSLRMDETDRKKIGFHTAGIVLLTLIVNGTTITRVYRGLKVAPSNDGNRNHDKLLKIGLLEADESIQKYMKKLGGHWFYHNCDFGIIEQLIPKLSEMVDHSSLDYFGKKRLRHQGEAHVHKAMLDLAKSFAGQLESDPNFLREHCAAKISLSHSRSSLWLQDRKSKGGAPEGAGARFATLKDNQMSDPELMAEVFQTVVNATEAEYAEAYEERKLGEAPYRVLSISLQYTEEAVWGELGLPKYGVPSPDFLENDIIAEMADASREQQMKDCFKVGWAYLKSMISKPRRAHMRLLHRLLGHKTVALDWTVLTRDVMMVLQYVNTCEHILEDTRMLEGFNDMLCEPMMEVKNQAMTDAMKKLMEFDYAMFVLLEHRLCAHRIIVQMRHLVQHLTKEGTLNQDDAKRLFSEVIRPTEDALELFLPSKESLELMMSVKAHKVNPRFDRFLYNMVLERNE